MPPGDVEALARALDGLLERDEGFYVLDGSGAVVVDGERREFSRGSTVIIPKNTWHCFENPEEELLLLWMVSPAGLDEFFRDTCSVPGAPPKGLTQDRIREIALTKYGTEFR